MDEIIIGKMSDIAAVTRRNFGLTRSPFVRQLVEMFPLLKSEENIKIPVRGQDLKKVRLRYNHIQQVLKKEFPNVRVGCCIRPDFVYLFSRGPKEREEVKK